MDIATLRQCTKRRLLTISPFHFRQSSSFASKVYKCDHLTILVARAFGKDLYVSAPAGLLTSGVHQLDYSPLLN